MHFIDIFICIPREVQEEQTCTKEKHIEQSHDFLQSLHIHREE